MEIRNTHDLLKAYVIQTRNVLQTLQQTFQLAVSVEDSRMAAFMYLCMAQMQIIHESCVASLASLPEVEEEKKEVDLTDVWKYLGGNSGSGT